MTESNDFHNFYSRHPLPWSLASRRISDGIDAVFIADAAGELVNRLDDSFAEFVVSVVNEWWSSD